MRTQLPQLKQSVRQYKTFCICKNEMNLVNLFKIETLKVMADELEPRRNINSLYLCMGHTKGMTSSRSLICCFLNAKVVLFSLACVLADFLAK